ncbi:MAG: ABC transporter substrate-binding protein [Alphaproteobacteria bacterium]|nr:ABC transporter substrate-binding protein [Alphaproteobacteria bacterium]
MSQSKRLVGMVAASAIMIGAAGAALAADPIKIGEINSYTALADFTQPYRKGWQMAVNEINAKGGVIGRPLEVIARDDAGKPENAVSIAEELVTKDKVDILAGTYFSHIGVAVTNFSKEKKKLFIATEPMSDDITWAQGHNYTFRLRASTHIQSAMLAEEAAKTKAKRWAIVSPNYKFGQDAVAAFKRVLKEKRPDVEFVVEQWPALGKIDAGATVQALAQAKPDGIFNALFSRDLTAFVREADLRGLLTKDLVVAGLLTGEPEYLEPLGAEAPQGWIVTGYPWYAITDPKHKKFIDDYQAKYKETPKMGSLIGYVSIQAIAAMIQKAGSVDQDKLIVAMKGLTFDSVAGPVTFRDIDHQSTLGAWVGKTAVKDGKPIMVDWRYTQGPQYSIPDEEIKKLRGKE